jgi:hypothetical protein
VGKLFRRINVTEIDNGDKGRLSIYHVGRPPPAPFLKRVVLFTTRFRTNCFLKHHP